jgi:NAD(P)-dependent dehydrogenase (short-subunit alcohol dehydrogenase family)
LLPPLAVVASDPVPGQLHAKVLYCGYSIKPYRLSGVSSVSADQMLQCELSGTGAMLFCCIWVIPRCIRDQARPHMRGKTVVITGGTSGIGEAAAVGLARMGARIVLVARDRSRGNATLARLNDSAPGIAHSVHSADLLRLAEVKRIAAQIADQESRIDILINNAGALFATRKLTEDGLERTFALNHMAYFVMTDGLRERLLASSPARIINTASASHQGATLEFDDLQSANRFGPMKAYGRSKLCNILFTRELARRLHGTGVTANSLHPGFVATRFGDQSGGVISHLVGLAKFFATTPAKGAETIVYLASSPDVAAATGHYYYKSVPTVPSLRAQDDRAALLLWQRSAALAGIKE